MNNLIESILSNPTLKITALFSIFQSCLFAAIQTAFSLHLNSLFHSYSQENINAEITALTLYHALYLAAFVFQFILTIDAIYLASMLQIIAVLLVQLALFAYAVIQHFQTQTITNSLLPPSEISYSSSSAFKLSISLIIVVAILSILFSFLAFRLHRLFGWRIFKFLGANSSIRKKLQIYHLHILLLKLDIFFFLAFSVQYLILVLAEQSDHVAVILHACIAFPTAILLLFLGFYAIHSEKKSIMYFFVFGLIIGIGYIISKIIDIFIHINTTDKYKNGQNSLLLTECITLSLSLLTLYTSFKNIRLFGTNSLNKFRHVFILRSQHLHHHHQYYYNHHHNGRHDRPLLDDLEDQKEEDQFFDFHSKKTSLSSNKTLKNYSIQSNHHHPSCSHSYFSLKRDKKSLNGSFLSSSSSACSSSSPSSSSLSSMKKKDNITIPKPVLIHFFSKKSVYSI